MAKTQKTVPATVVQQKVTVVVTVLNEEKTILQLLEALESQTHLPNEIIITDGGSVDRTLKLIHRFAEEYPKLKIKVLHAPGNRSVGRNAAIAAAHTDLIAVTDAGCVPQSDWLYELLQAAERATKEHKTDTYVISGYYTANPRSAFEEAVVPYVLVMPDKVNPKKFLPATRSMLMTKSVWQKLGGFDEQLSDNEDYAFARKIDEAQTPIVFTPLAIVEWIPRQTLKQFFWMIYRFARGDIFAGIVRPKVLLVFARYLIFLFFLMIAVVSNQIPGFILFAGVVFFLYANWAIKKNRRYVQRGKTWLPLLQFTADFGVMMGSLEGVARRFSRDKV